MGTVFEVENLLTQKRAAIKWLHPRFQSGEGFAKRMLREARAMARIRHQNVVDVYDVLLDDDDICVVMELLQGELLADRLARAPISISALLSLLLPAMRGVAAAHAVGVIHRDIKPDNIFLAQEMGQAEPTPKVIDFGISKVFNADEDRATCSGVTMGTPRYVSYEQLRGLRDVDGRTDIYAFGVILFEALTGHPPYAAETFGQQAIQFVTSVPPSVRSLRTEVPEKLARSVERAIARDREHRHGSLAELVDELAMFARSDSPLCRLQALFGSRAAPPGSTTPGSSTEPLVGFCSRATPPASPALVDASRTTSEATSLAPASNQARSASEPIPIHWRRPAIALALALAIGTSLSWTSLTARTATRAGAREESPEQLRTGVQDRHQAASNASSSEPARPSDSLPVHSPHLPTGTTSPAPAPIVATPHRLVRATRSRLPLSAASSDTAEGSPATPSPVLEEPPESSPARSGPLTRSEF